MKKLLFAVVALLMVVQLGAQSKAVADAQKALDKAKAETENPKKSGLPASWVKLANAYIACFDAPAQGLLQGSPQMQVKLLIKDQQVLSSGQEEIGGKLFTVDKYSDKNLYYDENGVLVAWTVTKPVLENGLALAFDAINKAAELDAAKKQTKAINDALTNIKNKYYEEAMSNYTLGNYSPASVGFEKTWEVGAKSALNQIDSTMAYYAAITATMAGEKERAIKLYEYCLSINYEMDGDVHSSLADNYKATGDTVKCKEILTEAFAKYPNSQSVLVALINVYMESNDDPEKILEILKVAQNNEPNNASLVYAEGSLYRKLNQFEKAIASFNKATEVDAKYVFAPFAAGCAYYDWAVDIQEKAQNELDDNKYNALLEQMEKALQDAIAPFEKAFEIAEDKDIKLACAEYLKNIYFRFREKGAEFQANHEKYNKYVEENK